MKRRKTRTGSEAGVSSSSCPPEKKITVKTTSSAIVSTVKKNPSLPSETLSPPLSINETELEKREAAKDVDLFQSVCGEISKLVEEIQDLKKQGREPTVSLI